MRNPAHGEGYMLFPCDNSWCIGLRQLPMASQPADHAAFSSLDEALKWLSDRHAVVILDGQPDTPARPVPAETEGRDDG